VCRDGAPNDGLLCNGARSDPQGRLLDLSSQVDGLEVLSRLKQDGRTPSIPVVVLTSSGEEPDIDGPTPGANSYIVKPVDFEAFARAVSMSALLAPAHHPPQ